MEKPCKTNQISFVQLFTRTSIHPHFTPFQSTSLPYNFPTYLISNLWIDFLPTSEDMPESVQCLPLNSKLGLFVKKTVSTMAVTNIGIFMKAPEGWDKLQYPKNADNDTQEGIYIKRSKCLIGKQHVQSISIEQNKKQKMKLETTEPTLTQNDDSENLQLPIHELNVVLKVKKAKISLKNFEHITFQPHSEAIFLNFQNQKTDLRTLSYLCYPKGVHLYTKPAGFQTYNFIMTLQNGQRLHCYCLAFREKCCSFLEEKILAMLGEDEGRQFYVESTFSLISQYSCTDQVLLCLEALYKLYLSSKEEFQRTISNLPKLFTKCRNSSICKFDSKFLTVNWKVNTSYPNTSHNAIYSVFKFLSLKNILEILEGLLLEAKIFFISDSKALIGYAIESFLSFIFPLKWVHIIISIMPENSIQLVQAPMPTIFGLSSCQVKRIQEEFHSSVEGIYVYLDENKVVDLRSEQEQSISLPKILKQGLEKRLKKFQVYDKVDVRDYLNNPQSVALFKTREVQDPQFNALKIRNVFLELMVALMRNYSDYFIDEKKEEKVEEGSRKSLKKIYKIDQIKKYYKSEKFLCNFFDCCIFTEFIDLKYSQPTNKWIKFFDKARKKVIHLQQRHLIDDFSQAEESEDEEENEKIPKGCLSMINMFSKESEEDRGSGKKKSKKEDDENSVKSEKKSIQTEDNPEDKKSQSQKQPQTTEQFNDMKEEEELAEGPAGHVCLFFSFPYKKIANSRVGKKIGQRIKKFKNWLMRKNRHESELYE